jgi:hypothetical protein
VGRTLTPDSAHFNHPLSALSAPDALLGTEVYSRVSSGTWQNNNRRSLELRRKCNLEVHKYALLQLGVVQSPSVSIITKQNGHDQRAGEVGLDSDNR